MLEGYRQHPNGVIEQIDKKPFVYDINYVSYYDKLGSEISRLRLDNIIKVIGKRPSYLLDVGYGNGDFIRHCLEHGESHSNHIYTWGTDISNYPIPKGAGFIPFDHILKNQPFFDVITFFDSLEHFQDISFLGKLNTEYVVVSVPWCHYFSDEWFENWKHRKVDEHIWYFNYNALSNLMKEHGFSLISVSNIEDAIRKPIDAYPNILTAVFKHG